MSNDDSFRGGPRRPGGGFRPRGDGPRPAGPPRDAGDRPRKPFFRDGDAPRGPRRDFGDAPQRDFSAGPRRDFGGPGGPRREGGAAPRRSFDGPRDFRREGDAPRGPRREFGDAPQRDFSAGPRRDFGGPGGPRREGGDAPRRSFDGPRDFRREGDAPRGPRREFGDAPKRDFSAGPRRDFGGPGGPRREGGDAPRRSFDGPRDFRREGDAPRGPRREFGDAPRRDFSGPGGPRREGGDAPRRSFDGPRDFRREGDAPRGPRREFGDAPRRDFRAPAGPRRDGSDAPRRRFEATRDFRRDDAPVAPGFARAEETHRQSGADHGEGLPEDLLNPLPAMDTEGLPETATLSGSDDHPNDDWEVPLPQDADDDNGADSGADQTPGTDDLPPIDAPQPATDPDEVALAMSPPAFADRRGTSAPRDPESRSREDFRRSPDRADARGFDADARRAQRQREVRIHGMNACLAVIRDRRDAVRKVYLRNDRAAAFGELLEWCRSQHLAYRYVTDSELSALTSSEHHEGICLEIERKPFLAFETLLNQMKLDHGPKVLLLLDGVGNPHNIGGILRAAAHFGVQALLLPPESALQLSAATYRTAEGGAELIPIVKLRDTVRDLEALGALDFHVIGSFPREATSIHTTRWPERTVLVIGAEHDGIRPATAALCDRRFTIPGSGLVESLNAATATAVLLSAYAGSLAREAWAASKA